LEHFTAIWYNLRPFGIVCGHLVYFQYFLVYLDQAKSGNPAQNCVSRAYSIERKMKMMKDE
jgi:hypothetical protein